MQAIDRIRGAAAFLAANDPRLIDTSALAPGAFTPDATAYLFVVHTTTRTGSDIWKLDLQGERRAVPLVQRPRDQWAVRVSPDGRWFSYASDESGQFEVYIESLAGGSATHRVSTDGGGEPVWSPMGGELFYRAGNQMMSVPIGTRIDSPVGVPRVLFTGQYGRSDLPHYDVTRDGQRFVMIQVPEAGRTLYLIDHGLSPH